MEEEAVKFINFQFTTIDGSIRQLIHPARDVEKVLEKDLSRRDFTMNAIAIDPVSKKVVDPYNGRQDIENRTNPVLRKSSEGCLTVEFMARQRTLHVIRSTQHESRMGSIMATD